MKLFNKNLVCILKRKKNRYTENVSKLAVLQGEILSKYNKSDSNAKHNTFDFKIYHVPFYTFLTRNIRMDLQLYQNLSRSIFFFI